NDRANVAQMADKSASFISRIWRSGYGLGSDWRERPHSRFSRIDFLRAQTLHIHRSFVSQAINETVTKSKIAVPRLGFFSVNPPSVQIGFGQPPENWLGSFSLSSHSHSGLFKNSSVTEPDQTNFQVSPAVTWKTLPALEAESITSKYDLSR